MDHPKDLLPDYAAGLLDEAERAQVEAHLASCEACMEEVRELDQVFADWVDALPEMIPSERPHERLFERLREEREPTFPDDTLTLPPRRAIPYEETPSKGVPSETPSQGVPYPVPSSPQIAPWLIAACAALLLVTGVFGYQTGRTNLALRAEQALITRFLSAGTVQAVALYDESDTLIGNTLVARGEPQDANLENRALFVLAEPPPGGRVYQAWGHVNDDWEPSSSEQLTSLEVSRDEVFEVSTQGFASLYLSLEPPGGSPQPTDPLSRVSLSDAAPGSAVGVLELLSPTDGETLQATSTIVRGQIDSSVRELRYRLNGGESVPIIFSGGRFMFTVSGLREGENRLELLATPAQGEEVSRVLTLNVESDAP